jgi:hypothetical protein
VAELHRDQCRLLSREGGLSNDILGRPFRPRFAGPAAAFTLAAVAVALVRNRQPFDHGWWLVAYLAVVGGLSQLILGAGQFALRADSAGRRVLAGQLVLWNVGAGLVPIGVFAGAPVVVAVGSVVLLAALALFAATTGVPRRRGARDHRFWLYAYRVVAIFLAGSVIVGTGLADALPWQ